jgi:rSAM/selenodomain-associated transferase 2
MKISVVIPVYRERGIVALLEDLLRRIQIERTSGEVEITVVDGAPEADTLARIGDMAVSGLSSPPGRGVQLNLGALASGGEILLFLHADTILPENAFSLIRQTLHDKSVSCGAFSLSYEPRTPGLSFITTLANLRSRHTRVPYGDQAIFVRRDVFEELGGFLAVPIMEDLEFMTRLRRHGHKLRILAMPVRTSARRQLHEGILRCTLRNLCLRLLYHCGIPPRVLAGLYRRHGG